MSVIGVIPARMGSGRFPGKPMEDILGMPMVGHCVKRAELARSLDQVILATCDQIIFDYGLSLGVKTIMTSSEHSTASDRAAEAMLKYEESSGDKVDILVMIQGDEPMIFPEMIDSAVEGLRQVITNDCQVVNLVADIKSEQEFEDPGEIKVVMDNNGFALFMSREPIPSRSKITGAVPMKKQVCVIPFTRDYLLEFNNSPTSSLESVENIDMLRVLQMGHKVKMIPTDFDSYSVDTPEDLAKVIELMKNDSLRLNYQP